MSKILKPNPELAAFITKECVEENWESIITRIWPNTRYLDVIITGDMAQYIPTLEYFSGGLPMACTMYASSECYFGLNLTPMCKPSKEKEHVVSIDFDKTDESELQQAIEKASVLLKESNTRVVEYTSYANTKYIPCHYVIYWELFVKDTDRGIFEPMLL
ncbi:hypothetical protein V6N13_072387 [Hibiscus sabdariffa]